MSGGSHWPVLIRHEQNHTGRSDLWVSRCTETEQSWSRLATTPEWSSGVRLNTAPCCSIRDPARTDKSRIMSQQVITDKKKKK